VTPPQVLTSADKHSSVDDLNSTPGKPLRICMVSLHGLIRGDSMELGRDADTGGQVKYVVELARELGRHKNVARVDLLTRQIIDQKVSADYAQPEEPLGENARIVRIPFGPKRYLAKEKLWPYLELFTDQALSFFRRNGIPDVIHGHYADAGRAGAELARLLHVPFVFTGHSLGRVKNQRLLADPNANPAAELEKRYLFAERFEAEEKALETASMIVTSTSQEIDQQYDLRTTGDLWEDWSGQGEKWLYSNVGWMYVTPDGGLFEFAGNDDGTDRLIYQFSAEYHQDVSLLYNAYDNSQRDKRSADSLFEDIAAGCDDLLVAI